MRSTLKSVFSRSRSTNTRCEKLNSNKGIRVSATNYVKSSTQLHFSNVNGTQVSVTGAHPHQRVMLPIVL
jgi:hypothetical protein